MNPAVYYLSSIESYPDYIPTEVYMPNGQVWDQYNLNTARYSDGTLIPKVGTGWTILTTGAWKFYNNDSSNGFLFGRLYNWYAVNGVYDAASLADPNLRKDIAPEGWRVATFDDWQTLTASYGTNGANSNSTASGYLKEPGTTYWQPTNSVLTPPSGFNARGGGSVTAGTNESLYKYTIGYWWPFNSDKNITMAYNTTAVTGFSTVIDFNRGSSVRLIKKDIIIPGFTTTLSSYDANSIDTGGDIPTVYTENISERGIVWGTSPNPNIIGQVANKISSGSGGTGAYSITIPGLSPATQYYIRAYAIVTTGPTQGTAYAAQQSVVTQSALATITTNSPITSIEAGSAVGGGDITYINSEYTVITSGLVWSTLINPTVALTTKTTDGPTGTTTGSFSSTMTGLSPVTHYYVRAYATTSFGTAYGANVEFDTVAGTVLLYAYSLRRVVPGYTGPLIRVRNGSLAGSPQFDIPQDGSGNLDTAYLISVISLANIGYVTTFYDQNGSGKNLITTVAGREPRIVDTGKVLITKAGPDGTIRPATRWGLGFSNMQIQGVSIQVANMSIFLVCSNNTSTLSQRGIVMNGYIYPRVVAGTSDNFFYNGANRISMGATSSDTKIYSNLSTTTQAFAWKNNSLVGSYTGNGSGITSTVVIGINGGTGTELFNGTIQEMLFYTGDLAPTGPSSRSSITTNAMNYYGII